MKSQNIDRYRFEYKVGKATFDIFFFIDGNPFLLLLGVKAENFSFELEMQQGFVIDINLDNATYRALCKILGLKYDSKNPFSTLSFFKELNSKIPISAKLTNTVKPHELSPYRRNVEEADKIYFIGWRDNSKWGTNVTESNLNKTRELLGEQAYLRCQQKNISSCWSDSESAAVRVTLP
jgi:hypothetical protein